MIDARIIAALAKCPVFHGLEKARIGQVMEQVNYRVVHYDKGAVYALEGDPCRNVDIVVSGELTTRMTGQSGKYVDVTRLQAGNIVAPAFVYATANRFPVSVDAATDVDLVRMIPDEFTRLIDRDVVVRWNFIALLSNINHFMADKVRFLSLLTVRERIATMLLAEASRSGSRVITLDKSRQELADSFGVQKVSLIRCLTAMKDEGAIAIDGRHITIVDASKLK